MRKRICRVLIVCVAVAVAGQLRSALRAQSLALPVEAQQRVVAVRESCVGEFEEARCQSALVSLLLSIDQYRSFADYLDAAATAAWNLGLRGEGLSVSSRIEYVRVSRTYSDEYVHLVPQDSNGYLRQAASAQTEQQQEASLRACVLTSSEPSDCHQALGEVLWGRGERAGAVAQYRLFAQGPLAGFIPAKSVADVALLLVRNGLVDDAAALYEAALDKLADEDGEQKCSEIRSWPREALGSQKRVLFRIGEALDGCRN